MDDSDSRDSHSRDSYSRDGYDNHRQARPDVGLNEAELDILRMFDPIVAEPRSVIELAERVNGTKQTFTSSTSRPHVRPAAGQPTNPLFRTDAPWTQVATIGAMAAIEAAGATNTPARLSLIPGNDTGADPSHDNDDFRAILERIAGEAELATGMTPRPRDPSPGTSRAINPRPINSRPTNPALTYSAPDNSSLGSFAGTGPTPTPTPTVVSASGTKLSAAAIAAGTSHIGVPRADRNTPTVPAPVPAPAAEPPASGSGFGSMARAIESARSGAGGAETAANRNKQAKTTPAARIRELAQVQRSSLAQLQRNESHTIDLDRLAENLLGDDVHARSSRAPHQSSLEATGRGAPYIRALPGGGAGGLASTDELIEMTVVGGRAAGLARLGVPESFLVDMHGGDLSPAWREARQLLTRLLDSIPQTEPLPVVPGAVIAIVGGRYAAQQLATSVSRELGLDPRAVVTVAQAGSSQAGSSTASREPSTVSVSEPLSGYQEVKAQRVAWHASPVPTVVLLEADVRPDTMHWARKMLFALDATVAWGAVEARLKLEDISSWAGALGGLDALAFVDLDATTSPAAVLHLGMPIARLDGQPATPGAWADLLTERLS